MIRISLVEFEGTYASYPDSDMCEQFRCCLYELSNI